MPHFASPEARHQWSAILIDPDRLLKSPKHDAMIACALTQKNVISFRNKNILWTNTKRIVKWKNAPTSLRFAKMSSDENAYDVPYQPQSKKHSELCEKMQQTGMTTQFTQNKVVSDEASAGRDRGCPAARSKHALNAKKWRDRSMTS